MKKILFTLLLIFSSPVLSQEKELTCLTQNIYHEARNQSILGQIAVAYVTINRTKSAEFPNSICSVVYQRSVRGCQFTWVCRNNIFIRNKKSYDEIKNLARRILNKESIFFDPTGGATFYHAYYVSPYWNEAFNRTVRIDDHIFYKKKP